MQPSSKFSCSVMKYEAGLGDSYQGSGKTTMNDLSDEDPRILVAGFNQYGFLLNRYKKHDMPLKRTFEHY